jgi:predicted TIM-barrel fold metal-dependent hydrolase
MDQYELIQTSAVLNKQTALLEAVGVHHVTYRRASWQSDDTAKKLARLLSVTDFYGNLVAQASAQTAKDAMKIVAQEIEKDGLRLGTTDISEYEQPP